MASKAHMLGHGNCLACNEESLRRFEAMQRLRAVNAKLLSALEAIRRIATTDPTNLPQKMFAGDIAARATAAIEEARK